MMRWLISSALQQRVLVLALAIVLLVFGARSLGTVSLDVFPEFAPPLVEIQTEAPGLSTEEVESLISVPIENAVNGVPWLQTVRSRSVLGLSSVVLIFEEGTDRVVARQLVQERIAAVAANLPAAAHAPVILPPLSSTSRAMKIGLSSDTLSQLELSDLSLWTIRPRLMAVPGVANVAIWGQRDRELQVLVNPERLAAAGVTLDEVERATSGSVQLNAGGFVDTPNQRIAVQHVASIGTADELATAVLKTVNGAPIRLGDVASVVDGYAQPIGDAVIDGGPGILLIVEKQPWGNTLNVTRGVEAAIDALRPGLSGVSVDTTIFRPATFIEQSLDNLGVALAIGVGLVLIVLITFLYEWRSALISAVAIPLSLLAAVLLLSFLGYTLNVMVIAGLVIALGEVVDDAIIDVENITRRLRLNRAVEPAQSPFRVVLDASLEVRSAVVFASMIVVLVFVPVFFLEGLSGSFFRPLALAYVLAIAASLVVALTVTPALCLLLLRSDRARSTDSPLVARLKNAYRRVLPRLISAPRRSLIAVAATIGVGLAVIPFLGEQFLPNFKEYDFLMHWVEKPGTSLDAMRRITIRASDELRSIPGVRNFGAHIGRAQVADEVVGPNFTELWISLDPSVDYEATLKQIQEVVDGYPGLYRDVLTYLRERIKEVLTGASASVVVRIFGPEMDGLRSQANAVEAALADLPGVTDLHVEQQVLVPQIRIRIKPEAAAVHGLTAGDIRRATNTLISGSRAGQIYDEQKVFNVAVWGEEGIRSDVQSLRDIPLRSPSGEYVRLKNVADITIEPAPNEIRRERASRRMDVTFNAGDADLGTIVAAAQARVAQLPFERGYHAEFLGEYAALSASRNRLLLLGALVFSGIFVLLYTEFRRVRLAALVGLSLPFALVGGVAAVLLSGGILSLGSMVGFIAVLGIAARNGIMLISHYRHLEEEEGMPFGPALILRGAEERLAPILMTASCAALALLPLVVRASEPGHEIEAPMAAVILGGLITSTALNLFLIPALYAAYGRDR